MESAQVINNNMDTQKVKKIKKSTKKEKPVETNNVTLNTDLSSSTKLTKSSKKNKQTTNTNLESDNTTESSNEEKQHTSKPVKFVNELIYIPVPRVRKYINDKKINRIIEEVLTTVKKAKESKTDLDIILTDQYKEIIGLYMETRENKEEHYKKLGKTDYKKLADLDEYGVANSAISKLKYKFSNNSFQVVSIILDKIVNEITELTIKNVLLNKKTTLNQDYSIMGNYTDGTLYSLYNKSKTYLQQLKNMTTTSDKTKEEVKVDEIEEEVDEEVDETEVEETDEEVDETKKTKKKTSTKINFEFHIRKIVGKLKSTNEDYNKIKISGKYCTFCSNIILDVLDRIVTILNVLVQTNNNKTITKELFVSVFKIILIDNGMDDTNIDTLFTDVEVILDKVKDKKEETKQNNTKKSE
jgi:hypothetical protein